LKIKTLKTSQIMDVKIYASVEMCDALWS